MPTPVGPVPKDPDDPDLWEEWEGDPWADDDTSHHRGFPIWLRVAAVILLLGLIALFVIG